MAKKNTILLVGLGAIGSVLYARLNRAQYKVICLTSVEGTKYLREKGVIVKLSSDIASQLYRCEIYSVLPEKYVFDKCVISTKAWVNEFLVDELQNNLSSNASILLFQNGIDNEKPFLDKNKDWKITRALTSLAAYREQKNHSIETTTGQTKLGSINYEDKQKLQEWINLLNTIGLKSAVSENMNKALWLKAVTNCSMGPLSAITGLRNGEILKDSFLNRIAQQLIEEILSVVPDDISLAFDEAYAMVEDIMNQSANNKSSMLQDIENKSKTEIDMLNGKIIKFAKEKNLEVPINEKIVELVKKLNDDTVPKEQIILDLRGL